MDLTLIEFISLAMALGIWTSLLTFIITQLANDKLNDKVKTIDDKLNGSPQRYYINGNPIKGDVGLVNRIYAVERETERLKALLGETIDYVYEEEK